MVYKFGKIYRIVCLSNPEIQYVGATVRALRLRWLTHVNDSKHSNRLGHCSIAKYINQFGKKDFKILLIKEYKVCAEHNKDHTHLSAYEQLWINKLKCINIQNPVQIKKLAKKKYINEHKKEKQEYDKAYREANHDKRIKNGMEYYRKNKDILLQKQKEYHEKNKITRNEQNRLRGVAYRADNKDKIKESREKTNPFVVCECGCTTRKYNLKKHYATKKHQDYLHNED
jgi:hypothetical protein